ncbi:MAG: hypothetical protein AAFQ43_11655, partial [Bacteroidota bacterium]
AFVDGHDGARYRDPVRVGLAHLLVDTHLARDDLPEAARWLHAADSLLARLPLQDRYHGTWRSGMCLRGRLLTRQRRFAEAEPALRVCAAEPDARAPRSPFPVPDPPPEAAPTAALYLAALYDDWGRAERADPYRDAAARVREAEAALRRQIVASGVLTEPLREW